MNKIIVLLVILGFGGAVIAGPVKLKKLWQTEAVLKVPESVLYDAKRQVLYVSNINGKDPWADDGQGSIAKVALDGKVINAEWVKGLHAPKGMGLKANLLYVTDNDDVVSIDLEKGVIVERLPVPNAGSINDLSVAQNGIIYISDSELGKIYQLEGKEFTTLASGISGLNGVLHSDGELVFVADGGLYIFQKKGKSLKVANGMKGYVDGVERVDANSWLVSCWKGTVYLVSRNGDVKLLLDGRPEEISAADLGYDPVGKIAFFPGFWKNYIAAYQLTLE